MDKKQLEKIVNIAIPILAVLLIAESIYAVVNLNRRGTGQDLLIEEEASPSALVAMKMSTDPVSVEVGEEFTLWVKAELLENYKVSGSDVFLDFDASGFEVMEDEEGGVLVEKGVSFPQVLRNVVNQEESQIIVSVVTDGGVELESGTIVDLVGIRLRALESGDYDFYLTKKGEGVKAGSTFIEQNDDASEIEFTVEDLSVSVI